MNDRAYYVTTASIVAVALATGAWALRLDDRVPLSPEATEKALGRLGPGQLVKVPFRFHNGSSRPLQIVGATSTCNQDGCFGPNSFSMFPMTIPPGGDGVLDSSFKAGNPGTFSHPMTVFTDCKQAPKFVLSVTGQIVDMSGVGGL